MIFLKRYKIYLADRILNSIIYHFENKIDLDNVNGEDYIEKFHYTIICPKPGTFPGITYKYTLIRFVPFINYFNVIYSVATPEVIYSLKIDTNRRYYKCIKLVCDIGTDRRRSSKITNYLTEEIFRMASNFPIVQLTGEEMYKD